MAYPDAQEKPENGPMDGAVSGTLTPSIDLCLPCLDSHNVGDPEAGNLTFANRARCQRCARRPRNRHECLRCRRLVGTGCCWHPPSQTCIDCIPPPPEPEPEPSPCIMLTSCLALSSLMPGVHYLFAYRLIGHCIVMGIFCAYLGSHLSQSQCLTGHTISCILLCMSVLGEHCLDFAMFICCLVKLMVPLQTLSYALSNYLSQPWFLLQHVLDTYYHVYVRIWMPGEHHLEVAGMPGLQPSVAYRLILHLGIGCTTRTYCSSRPVCLLIDGSICMNRTPCLCGWIIGTLLSLAAGFLPNRLLNTSARGSSISTGQQQQQQQQAKQEQQEQQQEQLAQQKLGADVAHVAALLQGNRDSDQQDTIPDAAPDSIILLHAPKRYIASSARPG